MVRGDVVDPAQLAKVIGGSLAVGLGLCSGYSLGLLGTVRGLEARRAARPARAVLYALLAALGAAATLAGIAAGLLVVINN